MKTTVKRLSVFVCISFLLTFITPYSFAAVNGQNLDSFSGIEITEDSFNQLFVRTGAEGSFRVYSIPEINEVAVAIESVTLSSDNTIVLRLTINDDVSMKTVSFDGKLFDSYKREDGCNSFVGVFDKSNGYSIKLFEVYNDTIQTSSLLNPTSATQPHLKLYIQDPHSNLLMFEMDIPEALSGLDTPIGNYADSIYDALWYVGIAQPFTDEEIAVTPALLNELGINTIRPFANGYDTQYNFGSARTASFYVGSDYAVCTSLPYVIYKHLNVSNDTTWYINFKVAEHTTLNGVTYRSVSNVFRYRNVELKMAAGGNTSFVRTVRQGRMQDSWGGIKKAGDSISAFIMKKAVSAIPYGPTISEVLGWISTAGTSETITLGPQGVSLSGSKNVAVGSKIGQNYDIFECTDYDGYTDKGHYLYFQAVAQYDGTGSSAVNTTGYMRCSFDTFSYSNDSTTSTTNDFSLVYTSSKP